jgi:hypothetical protein
MLKIIGKLTEQRAVHVLGGRGELEVFCVTEECDQRKRSIAARGFGCGLGQVPQSCVSELASDGCRSDIKRVG